MSVVIFFRTRLADLQSLPVLSCRHGRALQVVHSKGNLLSLVIVMSILLSACLTVYAINGHGHYGLAVMQTVLTGASISTLVWAYLPYARACREAGDMLAADYWGFGPAGSRSG